MEEKQIDRKKAMRNVLTLLSGYKLKITLSLVFIFLSTLFNIFSPLLIGDAITILFEGSARAIQHTGTLDFASLFNILIILIVLYVLTSLFGYLGEYLLSDIVVNICFTLKERLINKVTHLPMEDIDSNKKGDILSRITNDVDTLESGMIGAFLEMFQSGIVIIGVLIVMLAVNIWMTLAILVLVPITFLLIRVLSNFSQKYFTNELAIKGAVNSQIEEVVTSHDIIRTFNYENSSIEHFKNNNSKWYDYEWKAQFFASLNNPAMSLISNAMEIIIAVLGSIFVLQGAMPVGRILTFFQYAGEFISPITEVTNIMPMVQMSLASCDRIFEFLELEDESNPGEKEITEFRDEITFENISFSYVEGEKIIDDLSLTVKKGENIAIVGETGAGKTTLIKLLMRLYDLDSGEIKIDGVNINEYDKHSLRSMMGMVLQDSWLFSDTIENNIKYGKLDATEDEVLFASENASTDSFIRQLPDGYKTKLNEDSDNISYGQKQLLTIARTIISGKGILILDEATSSVDTRTEKLIQKAASRLMKNTTSFIIAHRLSTIRNADKIIVLGNGSIIEQGTHDELIAQKGYYYNTLNYQNS
ncbi:ABC transporter ATP-binding protein [Methanobrevibacter sp.]|uniref:ABC transporter ATP-binding protein n=1 Tax=Methanobrevibacter sp. TaxID=66852 RepID=UPI0038905558